MTMTAMSDNDLSPLQPTPAEPDPAASLPNSDTATQASGLQTEVPADEAAPENGGALPAELLQTDQYSEYLLHSPLEVLALLRQVYEHGDLVTIYFNSGKDFLLTSLIGISKDGLLLDRGSSSEMNRRALDAEKLFCITRHAKVRLQFLLTGIREVEHEGRKVFSAALPETILRLQRRAFYRLSTPISRPLILHMPVQQADGENAQIEIQIIDISAGGISVLAPSQDIGFVEEATFANCSFELPEIGVISTSLTVRNLYEVTLRNGHRSKRAGCQYLNLPVAAQNLIQRYIIKIERERKARESGLA